jgi:hypothetical protein
MASVTLQLQPFPVPTHVTVVLPAGKKQDGAQALPQLLLKDLSDEALEALITEFAENVMKVARPE